jgi:hypothetical protein
MLPPIAEKLFTVLFYQKDEKPLVYSSSSREREKKEATVE